jgi:hypothetical protein
LGLAWNWGVQHGVGFVAALGLQLVGKVYMQARNACIILYNYKIIIYYCDVMITVWYPYVLLTVLNLFSGTSYASDDACQVDIK